MRPYNLDVAWPDDAPVVKALDLGPRNVELARHYADRQPDRAFFRYDFADDSLTPLGTAEELAARVPPAAHPDAPDTRPANQPASRPGGGSGGGSNAP